MARMARRPCAPHTAGCSYYGTYEGRCSELEAQRQQGAAAEHPRRGAPCGPAGRVVVCVWCVWCVWGAGGGRDIIEAPPSRGRARAARGRPRLVSTHACARCSGSCRSPRPNEQKAGGEAQQGAAGQDRQAAGEQEVLRLRRPRPHGVCGHAAVDFRLHGLLGRAPRVLAPRAVHHAALVHERTDRPARGRRQQGGPSALARHVGFPGLSDAGEGPAPCSVIVPRRYADALEWSCTHRTAAAPGASRTTDRRRGSGSS